MAAMVAASAVPEAAKEAEADVAVRRVATVAAGWVVERVAAPRAAEGQVAVRAAVVRATAD